MENEKYEAQKKLFKAVYGALIDKDCQCLSAYEIFRTAFGALRQFAENEGKEAGDLLM